MNVRRSLVIFGLACCHGRRVLELTSSTVGGRCILVDTAAAAPGMFERSRTGHGEAGGGKSGQATAIFVTGAGPNPQVYVGGKHAEIVFIGQAPGEFAGLTQINFVVPQLEPGRHPIFIATGSPIVTSQAGVFLTVNR